MKPLIALAAALALSGCASLSETSVALVKTAAIGTIQQWNAAGVDPVQASPDTLAKIGAACGTAMAVVTVWNPAVPEADEQVAAFCELAMRAAAPAI